MNKKEMVYHLKGRWEAVHEVEVEELRKTSLKDRLTQTLSIFDLGKSFNLRVERTNSEIRNIVASWRRLKDYYSGQE